MTRRSFVWAAAAAVVGAAGCGENGPPAGPPLGTPAKVSGTVTMADGTPVRGGVVTFHPVEIEAGRKMRYAGGGLIDAAGQYKAGFNGDGAGLVPGEYKVTVQPREVGELPTSNAAQVPKTFQDKGTTTVTVTVDEKDNTIDVVLK